MTERLARALRVREARTRGIRAVPANPDPAEFPRVSFACDERPKRCDACTVARCPFDAPTEAA